MRRRQLIKLAAALPLAAPARLFAAPAAAGTKLLVVFLRGGYDAANVLVPVASPFYYEARPNIAIARPGCEPKVVVECRSGKTRITLTDLANANQCSRVATW